MEINNTNLTDLSLVASAKQGNQKAYAALMDKYKNSIYHLILKLAKKPEDAEDLMIETFAKAFDKLDSYSAEFAFSTWLYKITSNTCIDFLRKKSIDKIPFDSDSKTITDNILFSTETTPELDLIRHQRIDKIQRIVQSMDTIFARVLQLRYFEEYSYEEISAALQIPVGTIKVQLHRAKKQLTERLEAEKETW